MSIPSLNPLLATHVVCPDCGSIIIPEALKTNRGKVSELIYVCANEERGCAWRVVCSLQHLAGEMTPLPPKEVDTRRAQAAGVAQFRQSREDNITRLIVLLPKLEALAELSMDIDPEAAAKAKAPELQPVEES